MISPTPDEQPQPVPAEYGGKWIVWNKEGTYIVGVGATLEEAEQEAKEHGETETISEWIPPADSLQIGRIDATSQLIF